MDTVWFADLRDQVRASTQAKVAERLGVSRSTLTVFLNGSGEYGNGGAKGDRFERRYREAFEQIPCPHTGETVGVTHCQAKALRSAPTHNPMQLNHWKACQVCAYKPDVVLFRDKRRAKAEKQELPMAALDTKTLPLPEVGAPQIDLTSLEKA
ncbi:HTH cro/C1-type domain-containing protein [Cupriavidus sp. H19C3]